MRPGQSWSSPRRSTTWVPADSGGYARWNPVREYTQVEGVRTKVKAAEGTPFERDFEGGLVSVEPYTVASRGGGPETYSGRHRWERREVLVAEFDAFNQALRRVCTAGR